MAPTSRPGGLPDVRPPANTPIPSPTGWPARTPDEVAQNILRDPLLQFSPVHDPTSGVRLGRPTYVKGYTAQGHPLSLPDVWLIPVLSADRAVGVFAAAVLPSGNAAAGFYSGYAGSEFPHPLSRAEAMARTSTAGSPAVSAELMWSTLGTRQGLLVGLSEPFWRVVTGTGSELIVLQSGAVMPASDLGN